MIDIVKSCLISKQVSFIQYKTLGLRKNTGTKFDVIPDKILLSEYILVADILIHAGFNPCCARTPQEINTISLCNTTVRNRPFMNGRRNNIANKILLIS